MCHRLLGLQSIFGFKLQQLLKEIKSLLVQPAVEVKVIVIFMLRHVVLVSDPLNLGTRPAKSLSTEIRLARSLSTEIRLARSLSTEIRLARSLTTGIRLARSLSTGIRLARSVC